MNGCGYSAINSLLAAADFLFQVLDAVIYGFLHLINALVKSFFETARILSSIDATSLYEFNSLIEP